MLILSKEYLESQGFHKQDDDFIMWHDPSRARFVMREQRGFWWFFGRRTRNELEIKCRVGTVEEFEHLFHFMLDSHEKLSYNNSEKGW